jgi:hypothetical protein
MVSTKFIIENKNKESSKKEKRINIEYDPIRHKKIVGVHN